MFCALNNQHGYFWKPHNPSLKHHHHSKYHRPVPHDDGINASNSADPHRPPLERERKREKREKRERERDRDREKESENKREK